jgi:hypothetical protein
MLCRPREADDSSDQRVVSAVRTWIGLGKQFVETVGRSLAPTLGYVETQRPQPRRRHCDQQARLALTIGSEIGESRADELVAGKVDRHIPHVPIVGGGEPPYPRAAASRSASTTTLA